MTVTRSCAVGWVRPRDRGEAVDLVLDEATQHYPPPGGPKHN